VIAADGARSVSRACVGIKARERAYGQTALVTHIRTERPHRQTAWQRFLPQGPIAFLPLNDGRSSIVWTTTPEHAAELLQMDEAALANAIATAGDQVLGDVALAAPCGAFPLQLAQVDEYCRQRFVLVGDAAHSIHPLAGQGVNLGFMDAASLVQVLTEARAAGASLEALGEMPVLRRYERWRKTENTAALGLVDALNRLFSNDTRSVGALRRAGLRAIEQLPLAKRMLMLRALGLAGERPAIVRQAN
jgi:2-octaprenylphenol hydroxylase